MFSFVAGYLGGRRAMARAARAGSASGTTSGFAPDPVADLAEQVDRMALLIEAMWEILSRHGHTEQDLADTLDSIVQRRAATDTVCRECGARVTGSSRCQICGAETGVAPPALEGF